MSRRLPKRSLGLGNHKIHLSPYLGLVVCLGGVSLREPLSSPLRGLHILVFPLRTHLISILRSLLNRNCLHLVNHLKAHCVPSFASLVACCFIRSHLPYFSTKSKCDLARLQNFYIS